MDQEDKTSAFPEALLSGSSFPLLLLLAAFIQRGIIKTVRMQAGSPVFCEAPARKLFVIPATGHTVLRYGCEGWRWAVMSSHPSQWYSPTFSEGLDQWWQACYHWELYRAPHHQLRPSNQALHKKPGNCVGKSRLRVGSSLLVHGDSPLHTDGNKTDRKHTSLPTSQHCSGRTELWVLLHAGHSNCSVRTTVFLRVSLWQLIIPERMTA